MGKYGEAISSQRVIKEEEYPKGSTWWTDICRVGQWSGVEGDWVAESIRWRVGISCYFRKMFGLEMLPCE